MDYDCKPACQGITFLIIGIALILIKLYTAWDMWVVIGALIIILGLIKLICPVCPCHKKK